MSFAQYRKLNVKRGFSLLEVLVALAVLTLISVISYATFVSLSGAQVLEKDTAALETLLNEAQSRTRSSVDASRYGVYFDPTGNRAVLFKGSEYDPLYKEKEIAFNDKVYISEINLEAENEETVFERPKGNTFDFGYVTLSLVDDSKSFKISIFPTGVVEVSLVE